MHSLGVPDVSLPSSYGIVTYPPGTTFGPRLLRDYEFVWVYEGSAVYWRDQESCLLPPGSILLARPGVTEFYRWDTRTTTRHAFFHFTIASAPASWPKIETWPLIVRCGDACVMEQLFSHVLACSHARADEQCRLTIALLLSSFVGKQIEPVRIRRDTFPEPVEKAWTCLHENINTPGAILSLRKLAEVACVSSQHLCRLFQTTVGQSPVEAVRFARLKKARELLSTTNQSIKEIARSCSFDDPLYFTRQFHKAFGLSPRDLRRHLDKGLLPRAAG
jgi:AraC-like DNA-binding protein